ncbi:MAG: EscU/YscU/HrcU family type III secretion system export apparatus switch protein [Pirellula sp.]
MAESLESKKHPATQLRRRRADEEGVFPRSQEWSVACTWLVGIAILQWAGSYSFGVFSGLIKQGLNSVESETSRAQDWYRKLAELAFQASFGILPLLAGTFCVGLAVHFAQAGFRFRLDRLAWDFQRVLPRFRVGARSETSGVLVAGVLKLFLVLGVVLWGLWTHAAEVISWSDLPMAQALQLVWRLFLRLGWSLGLGWLALAGLDFGWNWWLYERMLRMTDTELREELKESQGDPGLRARRRRVVAGE